MESKKCFKLCNLSLDDVIICEIMELYAKYLSIFTSFYVSPALDYTISFKFTLEGISLKKLHEGNSGGVGGVGGV